MQNKTPYDYSIKQLKGFRKFFIVVAVILIIGGCALMPFGILFIAFGGLLLFLASGYKKVIDEKIEYESHLNAPLTDYVIIDFETTGLNSKTDRIIEIGALKVANGEIADTYSTYVNPMKHITKRVTDMNGISDSTVSDAPIESDILPEFAKFIEGSVLVGYNVNFDLNFLTNMSDRCNADFTPGCTVDVLKLVRNHIAGLENYKLETVMKLIEPNFIQEHRALRDCCATKKVLDYVSENKSLRELMQ